MESNEYNQLKKEISDLSKCVKVQGTTIKKIHVAIVGDKEFEQEGIVQMVKKHEIWINAQRFMIAKIYGGIVVGSTLGGLLVKFWDKIF